MDTILRDPMPRERVMNEIEALRWQLERYRAVLCQQVDRLHNALEEIQRTAIPFDFDWTSYHTYLSVDPKNNAQRQIRWTPPPPLIMPARE
jgi:hypothetical protein